LIILWILTSGEWIEKYWLKSIGIKVVEKLNVYDFLSVFINNLGISWNFCI
jgi:hypothetical protein